jgi:hypothetical protein
MIAAVDEDMSVLELTQRWLAKASADVHRDGHGLN